MVLAASRPPFAVNLAVAGLTDVGRKRERNEDAVLVRPELGLYVVADGAGGHKSGKVASALAVTSIANFFGSTDLAARKKSSLDAYGLRNGARRLAIAIQKANRDVVEIAAREEHHGMGSTIVAISIDFDEPLIHVAHVGDSRCYRVRAGHIDQLTHDHSLMNDVLSLKPDMPEAALAKLPGKVVTRALGMEASVRVSVRTFEVARGDRYLLCSDGLSGEVADAAILDTLLEHDEPHPAAAHLIALANQAGGRDNIAALVLHAEPDQDAPRPNMRASGIFDEGQDGPAAAAAFLGLEVVVGVDPNGQPITSRLGAADQRVLAALASAEQSTGPSSTGGATDPLRGPSKRERACHLCGARMQAGKFCPQCGST
jgi:serine/threonine protein phosphatase PrpC